MSAFAVDSYVACAHYEIVHSKSVDDVLVLATHSHSEVNMLLGTCGCSVYFYKING